MDTRMKVYFMFSVYCCNVMFTNASTSTFMPMETYRGPQQPNQDYLPPQTKREYLPPYSTKNNADVAHSKVSFKTFHTRPQINSRYNKKSNAPMHHIQSSYEPPASGPSSSQYKKPTMSNQRSLPLLIPKSVLEQLSPSVTLTPPAMPQHQQYQQQYEQHQVPLQPQDFHLQEHRQQLHHHQQPAYPALQQPLTIAQPEVPPLPMQSPFLMVDGPSSMLLSINQNRTLQAAKILASTLLEASGEAPLELFGDAALNSNDSQDPYKLNTTDVVIMKTQKNAYVIPTQLAKASRNSANVRELYQMRNQLEKAYTVNQFIFIIKPEKINFLNKLV